MKERKIERGYPCGGATDVRLESSTNWWDLPSLKSTSLIPATTKQYVGPHLIILLNDSFIKRDSYILLLVIPFTPALRTIA